MGRGGEVLRFMDLELKYSPGRLHGMLEFAMLRCSQLFSHNQAKLSRSEVGGSQLILFCLLGGHWISVSDCP